MWKLAPLSVVFFAIDQAPVTDPLVSYLTTAGAVGCLALAVVAFLKEWIVPGSRYRRVEQENDELRLFLRDQAVPTLVRVQDVVVKILEERAWDDRARRPKS